MQQLINDLSDIREKYGNRRFTVHYSPLDNTVEIALIAVFDLKDDDQPSSVKLDVITNRD